MENGGISQDGLVYTFELRDDVTWSDGERVAAGDFEFAIKRLLAPLTGAPFSPLYFVIQGAPQYASSGEADEQARQDLRDAVAVVALDEDSLRITLAGPSATFLQKMALVPVYPVRQDIVEEFGDQWTEAGNYIGNGPFVMTEWAHQDHITLEANPNYWGSRPELTHINFKMISDPNAELAAYRNDELELSQVPTGIEVAILADPSLADQVLRAPSLFSFGIFFNTTIAPFDDVKVRQAFTTAIDREAWINSVKNGVGQPATSWLPPGLPGNDPDLGADYTFDVEGARRLLTLAGFGEDGQEFPSVTYTFVDAGDQRLMAEFIQGQMKDNLGIDLILEALDGPSWEQRVIFGHQFELTPFGWFADYPDAESFFAPLFTSGSFLNVTGYSNSSFDSLAGLASAELDQEARLGFWTRAHELLVREAPVAFFFFGERFILKKPEVQGLALSPIYGVIPGDNGLATVSLPPRE